MASTSTHFEIKTGESYTFYAGYRYYANATATTGTGLDSAALQFEFEGASSTILGLGAIATSILISMF